MKLLITIFVFVIMSGQVNAQEAGDLLSSISSALSDSSETSEFSGRLIQVVGLMTLLSLAPGILVLFTSFTRFVIVFSMLRSALGLNQTPPNMVITSLALFMTLFVMQPVMNKSWDDGLKPLLNDSITEEQALVRIVDPFKSFMLSNTREQDLRLFYDVSDKSKENIDVTNVGLRELVPAFVISELRRAFVIGFLIYLPFIAIDLIIASVLMSAGMMMLPPIMVSLPFKVIFFVLVDGWYMVAGSLIESFSGV